MSNSSEIPRLYLGLDGGQSGTKALIADQNGSIIGQGRSGPCNHARSIEGRAKFVSAIEGSVGEACQQAGIDFQTVVFASVCLGLSGGPEDKDALARELIRSSKYVTTHDADIALSGATNGSPGAIVIAGTGSIAFGRNATGKTARAGGWGYIFGDEGGAFDLTRRALRAALRYEEGWGPHTMLHSLMLEATSARTADELLHLFYGDWDRSRIAGLAVLVTHAAEQSDVIAMQIIKEAGASLCRLLQAVWDQLFRDDNHATVSYIGGVFRSAAFKDAFLHEVKSRINIAVQPPLYSPSIGAVLQAMQADGNARSLSNISIDELSA